ncbi:uncharacterized protein LOC132232798 isoform X2 [Myotis daubentonii]|uniref:uncharacterized protein LOC132232798 isoform X2 n=1 Tax=Myotis daubentonii TaxID=98922 RepID=UPI0028736615|nr:uncharacterized protein LOC132232798 isoform X2 [Myotis daubentonii]
MVAGTAEPRPGRKRDGRRAPPSPPLGSAGRPAAPSPRRAQRRRAAPSPAPPLPTGRRRARSTARPTSGPSLRAGSRSPRGVGLARSFWLGGTRFCQRGKVKVLGIRETRRIYSVTSLDPGRTSRQILQMPRPTQPDSEDQGVPRLPQEADPRQQVIPPPAQSSTSNTCPGGAPPLSPSPSGWNLSED